MPRSLMPLNHKALFIAIQSCYNRDVFVSFRLLRGVSLGMIEAAKVSLNIAMLVTYSAVVHKNFTFQQGEVTP